MTTTTEDTSRYDKAAAILDSIFTPSWREKQKHTGFKAADDFARLAVEIPYADAWGRDAEPTVFDYVGLKDYIASLFDGPVDVVNRDGLKPYVGPAATADAIYAF